MGFYLNPPADGFESVLKSEMYVDKSGLITYINSVLGSNRKLICFSRPRRFGKTFAAQMLAAYYSRGIDSRSLFENLKVAKDKEFYVYLNKYDVLFLDITWFISNADDIKETVSDIQKDVIEELKETFPDCVKIQTKSLSKALAQISAKTGRKFFVIIDEWDALFREAKGNDVLQESYIQLLRSLFKGLQSSQFIVGAYMTGILPVKKYGTQSALTDFYEYTMLEPGPVAEYVGFTQEEVQELCNVYHVDFTEAQKWYDGYRFDSIGHVYNPNSIIRAILNKRFSNYWTQTETYESLRVFIDLDYDGLKSALVDMLGGQKCRIDTGTFQNDMTSLESRDDVFTLLVHLGYLAYDIDTKEVFIPNEEVREEFVRAIKHGIRPELVKAVKTSDKLLAATIQMDSETVAELIEDAHNANTAPVHYNNEQALRSVVIMAYLSCLDHYSRFEELTSGKGYTDLLFIPNQTSKKPALIIELKWNKSADCAITQIKDRDYMQTVQKLDNRGDILLVGISYDTKTGKHTCRIEKYHA